MLDVLSTNEEKHCILKVCLREVNKRFMVPQSRIIELFKCEIKEFSQLNGEKAIYDE